VLNLWWELGQWWPRMCHRELFLWATPREWRARFDLFEILFMSKQLRIGVLTGRTPYPHGMAATQRIHLMARAMAEAGAWVNVWVDGLDRWTEARNRDAAGIKDGIPYEYLLGKTQASRHKWRRVLDRFALAWAAKRSMAEAAGSQSLDGLYFYTSVLKPAFERLVVRNTARKNNFPVVLDLCEAPWTLKPRKSLVEKMASPLWGADGVICISRFLEDWLHQENTRTGRNVRHLYVPILADINEIHPAASLPTGKTVLFAGSPAYDETLRFLLAAMEVVWVTHADCQVVITGGPTELTLGPVAKGRGGRLRYAGFMERGRLLGEYSASAVLAIPLFDDVRSHARFPSKLGEYLASGRPVVTNRVGEIPRFLEDGMSACVTEPGDTAAFAGAICRLLEHPARGQAMGRKGRQIAERHFHYANYGARLCEFFSSLAVVQRL
jgi:glycosyltransferase involved in cell wall biosynthesis